MGLWCGFGFTCRACALFSLSVSFTPGRFWVFPFTPLVFRCFAAKVEHFANAARNERPNAKGPRQSALLLPTFPSAAPSVRPLATLSPVSVCHMRCCCCHCCCLCCSEEDTLCSLYVFLCKLESATHAPHTLPVFSACAVSCLCVSVKLQQFL